MQRTLRAAAAVFSITTSLGTNAAPLSDETVIEWESSYVQQGKRFDHDAGRYWALLSAFWQQASLYTELNRRDSGNDTEASELGLHLYHAFEDTDIRHHYGDANLVPEGSDITQGGLFLIWEFG
ncbi:MAG: hypothetical protein LPD71_00920 [Shewanella sp.]|nr:hypothetical protein [Shewanella sp.]MCF1431616.1 hypothetical protein [Shewanella sp.]MCF1437354.1 hypothetical protein [Shewanella sp.]MCF1457515.1 hypothetical protein [Shewanella sp.]